MKIFESISDEVIIERDWYQMVSVEEEKEERIEKDSRIVEVLQRFYSF